MERIVDCAHAVGFRLPGVHPCEQRLTLCLYGESTIIVVPPHAAARVPVSNVSADFVPPNGISMCVWASIPTGHDVLGCRIDDAVGTRLPCVGEPGPTCRQRAPPLVLDKDVHQCRSIRSHYRAVADHGAHLSGLAERSVGVGTPVPVERPQPADLIDHPEVEVAHDDFFLGIGG